MHKSHDPLAELQEQYEALQLAFDQLWLENEELRSTHRFEASNVSITADSGDYLGIDGRFRPGMSEYTVEVYDVRRNLTYKFKTHSYEIIQH